MQKISGLFFLLLISCHYESKPQIVAQKAIDSTQNVVISTNIAKDSSLLDEYFVDSVRIGKKTLNKIELSKYNIADSDYVLIKFFSKEKGIWKLKNEYNFEKDGIMGLDTKLSDFNNDGLNDMTYISAIATRGANEVRRLFIYDVKKDQLICMKNSEDYPNMLYNKNLNCIDAFLVFGGCSTVFLKISGDSLKEFASVELSEGLTVTTYDNNGQEKIIFHDTTNKAMYVRYKDFNPLKVNDEY